MRWLGGFGVWNDNCRVNFRTVEKFSFFSLNDCAQHDASRVLVEARLRVKIHRGEEFTSCRKRNEPNHSRSIHKGTSPFVIYFTENILTTSDSNLWNSLFGEDPRKYFTIRISNGRNKLRTHTVYYRELFKLPRERSQWKHLRITLNVICFMLAVCLFDKTEAGRKIYSKQLMSWIDASRSSTRLHQLRRNFCSM